MKEHILKVETPFFFVRSMVTSSWELLYFNYMPKYVVITVSYSVYAISVKVLLSPKVI